MNQHASSQLCGVTTNKVWLCSCQLNQTLCVCGFTWLDRLFWWALSLAVQARTPCAKKQSGYKTTPTTLLYYLIKMSQIRVYYIYDRKCIKKWTCSNLLVLSEGSQRLIQLGIKVGKSALKITLYSAVAIKLMIITLVGSYIICL